MGGRKNITAEDTKETQRAQKVPTQRTPRWVGHPAVAASNDPQDKNGDKVVTIEKKKE